MNNINIKIKKGDTVLFLPWKFITNIKKRKSIIINPTGKNDNLLIQKALDQLNPKE